MRLVRVLGVVVVLGSVILVGVSSDVSVGGSPGAGGYWLVGGDGAVFAFGDARSFGSAGGTPLNHAVVGMAATASSDGYWLVASDGGIFAFGDAVFFGSTGRTRLNQPIVGMAATPTGHGYWRVARDGGIFAFGDAAFYGSTGKTRLNQVIVGLAATPSGVGIGWRPETAGSSLSVTPLFTVRLERTQLNQPIVALAVTPSEQGYWLVARDGGIFAFGDATFAGSTGGTLLNQPIVGMAATLGGDGYWLTASDGGIFAFGSAAFFGSTGDRRLNQPVVGIVPALPAPGAGLLDQLHVNPEASRVGYDRDLFRHWVDADREGCDTRAEVLITESRVTPTLSGDCTVTSGERFSVYDGMTTTTPSGLDIDHLIPLGEAWGSGADRWDAKRREAFANDLGYIDSLVAVSASSNRSKGDQDPAEWIPPRREVLCDYGTWWATVKIRWQLSADGDEISGLRNLLETCPAATPTTTTVTTAPGGLGFGAMQCDGPGNPDDAHNLNDEWVDIHNGGAAAAGLSGWTLTDDANNTFSFPSGFSLGGGGTVKIHTGSGTDTAGDLYWGRSQHVWNTTGDTGSLRNPNGATTATKSC